MRLVSGKAIVVAVLSTIAMAASGCSGDSDAEAESPRATATEQADTQPPARPTVDIAKFRAAFKETYGTPPNKRPWYDRITGMKMGDRREIGTVCCYYRTLDVTTKKLGSPSDAGKICEAVFALNSETGNRIEAVHLTSPDGEGGCA